MSLLSTIKKNTIKINLESTEKDELFEELIDVLYQAGEIDDQDAALSAILKREEDGNTAITKGVALPHARGDKIKKISVVLGISKDGIVYESSFDPIHIIFLVIGPSSSTEKYISILSEIGKLLLSTTTIDELKKCSSAEEVISIIEKEESRINDD